MYTTVVCTTERTETDKILLASVVVVPKYIYIYVIPLLLFFLVGRQVTSFPEAEQEASADTPLIAPHGAQGQQQQQQQLMQMELASGNQVSRAEIVYSARSQKRGA